MTFSLRLVLPLLVFATTHIAAEPEQKPIHVGEFAITEMQHSRTKHHVLTVRGICTSSAKVVKRVNVTTVRGETHIDVETGLNPSDDKELSANFTADVRLGVEIRKVTFGPTRHVLWERTQGK